MKSFIIFIVISVKISFAQLSGPYYVGAGQTYTSLTGSGASGFFNAVNTFGLSGDVTVYIVSDISESGNVSLNQWSGSYNITIRPNSANIYNLTGNVSSPLINLNGADNLTVDGSFNGTGRYLRFTNLNTSNPVFRFINDATNNTIANCIIDGANTSSSSGLIFFSTTNGTTGNDNNTINNCLIKNSGGNMLNAIYSSGTTSSSRFNNGIIISNNEIADFYRNGFIASAVTLADGSTEWTITGNSFYQTVSRSNSSASGWNVIHINTSHANNVTISDNYIGGSSANCGGDPWTCSGNVTNTLIAIRFSNAGASTASNISSNIIKNINISSSPSSGGTILFAGISVESGNVNTSGNIIGDTASTGNISLNYNGNTNNIINRGINYSNAIGNISGNKMSSINFNGNNTSGLIRFEGINYTGTPSSNVTVSNNLIGSSNVSGSINAANPSMYFQMTGIYSTINSVTLNITNNRIINIVNTSTNSNAWTRGIFQNNSTSAVCNFLNNRVSELYSSGTNTSRFPNSCPIIGIYTGSNSTSQVVSGNVISGLRSDANANVHVQGFAHYNNSGSGKFENNRIYDLTNSSISSSPKIWGINAFWGSWKFYNNQIALTNGENSLFGYSSSYFKENYADNSHSTNTAKDDSNIYDQLIKDEKFNYANFIQKHDDITITSSTNGVEIKGIHDEAEFDCYFYYNSIYIGGTASSGSSSSWAYDRPLTSWPTPAKITNNIFFNARTGGTGKHYAIGNEIGSTNWTSTSANYNVYISSNPNTIGIWGTSDQTIDQWRTSSGGDKHTWSTVSSSLSASNLFSDIPSGNLSIKTNNYEAWIVSGKGIALSDVSSDYSGNSRSTSISGGCTDIGSHEFSATPPDCPLATEINSPGSGVTSTYRLWGRDLVVINWGTGGSQYPATVNVKYVSGVNPPNTSGGNYSNSYWDITPTGTLNGTTYDITLNFGDNETYTITSPNLNTRIAKYVSSWEIFSTSGTGAWQTELNWSNLNVKTRGMHDFSVYALTDASNPLPVELCSFTASKISSRNIELVWVTCWEINNHGFEIERRYSQLNSSSYGNWEKIGFVQGAGNSNEEITYKFRDNKLSAGKYQYRLKQIDYNGSHEYYDLNSPSEMLIDIPLSAELYQNYPNPSNPSSRIDFEIPQSSIVTLKVYDISGREVMTIADKRYEAGYYTVEFNGSSLASGIYLYRLNLLSESGERYSKTMKMVLIK